MQYSFKSEFLLKCNVKVFYIQFWFWFEAPTKGLQKNSFLSFFLKNIFLLNKSMDSLTLKRHNFF